LEYSQRVDPLNKLANTKKRNPFSNMNLLHTLPKNASIVILTGAGISAESGLETFRGAGGLWCGHRVEEVATPEAFEHNPELVHAFYNMRRSGLLNPSIKPNPAHTALARLEEKWSGTVLVITQNIDDLHERGGTQNLIHMHGELLQAFCVHCSHGTGVKIECRSDLSTDNTCPQCNQKGGLRPDIVWFGEMPYHMDEILTALSNCNLFIAIGTSGNVYPAAGLVSQARSAGVITIEMNLEPSLNVTAFDLSIVGPAGTTVPQLVDTLLEP
jgi:NAD-dependent deacetylase